MMRVLLMLVLLAFGMNAVAQKSGFTNPCNGSYVSYTDASMSGCVSDMERSFARWSELNPGVKKPGDKLTDYVAKRLPAGNYLVGDSVRYFDAASLGMYGPCAVWEFHTGLRTDFREYCVATVLPTIQGKVDLKIKELKCLDVPAVWGYDGQGNVTVTICNRTYRYSIDLPDCPCVEVISERIVICEGRDTLWRGKRLRVANTYRDSVGPDAQHDCSRLYLLNLDVTPINRSEEQKTIMRGDSMQFDGKWLSESGVYKRTAKGKGAACDTLVTLFLTVTEPPCDPCNAAFESWYRMGPLAAEIFAKYELTPIGWQRRFPLIGGGLLAEWKFKRGVLFRKNRCFGESLRLEFEARSANIPVFKPGGCLNCHNILTADKRLVEIPLTYNLVYLKGFPYTIGGFVGAIARYQRVEDQPSLRLGLRLGLEGQVYWKRFSLFVGPQVDWYPGFAWIPSVKGGFRYWVIDPGKSKNKKKGR